MWQTAVAQAGVNGAFGVLNNFMAAQRETAARAENHYYGELAANAADARTRALYKDLQSPEALRKQYQEAGLSPSLMFGGGGVGGNLSQGAQGTGASGINPTSYGINPVDLASIELMKAQAKKAEADANNTNKLSDATLAKIIAETKNTDLKSAGQELTNKLSAIENEIAEATKDNKIEISTYQVLQADRQFMLMKEELKQEVIKSHITEETAETIIKEEKQKLVNLQVQAALMRSNIELNKEQIESLATKIAVEKEMVAISWAGLDFKRDELEALIEQWGKENKINIGKIGASVVNTIIKSLTQ